MLPPSPLLALQGDGVTPLVFAASRGRTDITDALLARGALPNVRKVPVV